MLPLPSKWQATLPSLALLLLVSTLVKYHVIISRFSFDRYVMIWHSLTFDAYSHSLYLMKHSVPDSGNQKLIIQLVATISLFLAGVVKVPRPSTDTLLRRAEGFANLAIRMRAEDPWRAARGKVV